VKGVEWIGLSRLGDVGFRRLNPTYGPIPGQQARMVCYSRTKCYYQIVWPSTNFDAASNLHNLCDWKMIMNLIDFVETWWLSIRLLLNAAGVVDHFERSPTNRSNPSCTLNLRQRGIEIDLLVWESGEAELATIESGGATSQQHFDNIRINANLSMILSQVINLIINASSSQIR